MEFSEDAMENRHTKLSSSDHKINSSTGNCEFLSSTRKGNNLTEQIDNKQNTELGAEITTTHQVKTETTIAAATCAEIAEVEMPLDVPELQINTQAGNLKCEKPTGEEINAVYNDSLDNRSEYDADHGQPQNENSQQSSVIAEDDDDPDNSDDESSSDSDFSDMSEGSSEESGREWKPITKPRNWVQKQIHSGANPRELLSQMLPNGGPLAPDLNDMTLWHILASMLSEPPRRQKLRYVNTFADVIQLVRASKNIIVLTGAGVSVSCGIPDFRSSDGIYSRLAKDFPDLPDPQAMFDINYFSRDPRPFYKFAREIYPGQFKPSPCHRFIKFLELKQKLLRNYTQNIDTLEQVAGIENVIECHGSFSTASCTKCKFRTTAEDIRADIFAQRIPVCPHCQPNVQQSSCASDPVSEIELKEIVENGIMKPDIVFFGEGLPEKFHSVMAEDKDKCDLLIVIGSSLKVRPVALIPSSIPAHVPQILINREQLHHLEFDVELLGDSDVIINQMCHHLGGEWKQLCFDEKVLRESTDLLPLEEVVSCNEEEDVQQYRLDNDTQSVKSNASTDIALRSAGGYSDSGFESSTLSMLVGNKAVACANSQSECETTETMKEIETNVCNLSNPETKNSGSGNLPSPSLLEDNMDAAVGFEHPAFQPFNPTLCPDSYRHLSIDSSKDSGIQCNEFSNSAVNSLLPPLAHLSDSGGTTDKHDSFESVSATVTPTKELPAIVARDNNAKTAGSTGERRIKRRQYKRLSAAERLIEGTYYCHEETSSCVFPGGQVSWSSDSDEDEEEDEVDEDFEDDDEETEQALESISMLLPAVVEADVGTEIATTQCADVSSTKRQSSVETEITTTQCADVSSTKLQSSEENSGEENRMRKNKRKDEDSVSSANKTTMAAFCSPPPVKRRCDIYKVNGKQTSVAATISSTTDTCTVITGNSPEGALR